MADDRRDRLERLAAVAFEECGPEARHAAIKRALERVIPGDEPERCVIEAGNVSTAGASMEMHARRVPWLEAFQEALLLEFFLLYTAEQERRRSGVKDRQIPHASQTMTSEPSETTVHLRESSSRGRR